MNGNKNQKCKICKSDFIQYRSTQLVCSSSCALEYVKKKNAENKIKEKNNWIEKKKQWKAELETIPELIKKVEKEFNRYIRFRDLNMTCISCDKKLLDIRNYHAGHYYSAGNYSNIRFDERNVNGQCIECNLHLHGNPIAYRFGLENKIGINQLNSLDDIARTKTKWDREELNKLIIIYKLKVKIKEEEYKTKN